ncbi:MAG TPA: hypothetical protein VG889_10655 [Rhizomicrobium sp.]|nr:hypothetical protein [Rhizomicrobium sp.]
MATPRIFVSMGTPYTAAYASFRDELEDLLRNRCQTDPRILNKSDYPTGNPLHKIDEVMRSCDGLVIVAYERKRVETGIEKRGGRDQKAISNAIYTTPWNHVESAMAFTLKIPIYVLVERGLTEECLIESKVDWNVREIDFTVESLRLPEVHESIATWVRERVVPHAGKRRGPLEGFLRIRPGEFTIEEWIALATLAGAIFAAGVAVGHWLPNFAP